MKRKMAAMLLAISLVSLTACGSAENNTGQAEKESVSTETTAEAEQEDAGTEESVVAEEEKEAENETVTETENAEEVTAQTPAEETDAAYMVIDSVGFWNHTSDTWAEVYYQNKKDGKWIRCQWNYDLYENIKPGDGPVESNVTVYESYFAVKAITEDGTERLWTYNLVFGESREWIGEEIITKVIPDGKYLQFDITDINTSIMWSGTEEADTQDASANMVTEIQFPMTVTEIIVQDVGCFGGDFYYQLQENGSWNDSWIEYKDVDVIRVPEGIRLENPYFAIKGVAENGEEKMWTFDLTESIGKEKISAFAKEGDGSMFISDVLDDGSIIIQMILF